MGQREQFIKEEITCSILRLNIRKTGENAGQREYGLRRGGGRGRGCMGKYLHVCILGSGGTGFTP